jgi:hypothetical protein
MAVCKCVYGTVSGTVRGAYRIDRATFPYTQSQTDLNRTKQHWYGTGSGSDRAPTATGRFRWNPVATAPGTVPPRVPMLLGSI